LLRLLRRSCSGLLWCRWRLLRRSCSRHRLPLLLLWLLLRHLLAKNKIFKHYIHLFIHLFFWL
jgi:hypothetical protein